MEQIKLSVIIPVYNERNTIEELLSRVVSNTIEKEIIIVDDCSSDGSRELLQNLEQSKISSLIEKYVQANRLQVVFQPRNCGKGAALREGFRVARGEIILVQDADLEYDPRDYYKLVEPIEMGVADVVYGSRFLGGGPHRVLFFWHRVGNWSLTTLSNMLTNLNLTDVWTCYKLFKKDVIQGIQLKENRFGFEAEVTAKVARAKCRIYEVPISYFGRTYEEGKKIGWKDAVWGIWCTLKFNLFPNS
jgi:glycosyltransferase involved in cell wall biosynthesis